MLEHNDVVRRVLQVRMNSPHPYRLPGHRQDEPRECFFLFLFPTQIYMLVLESIEYEYERCMFLW